MKNKSYLIIAICLSLVFFLNCRGRKKNKAIENLTDSISGLTYINPVLDTTFPDPAIVKAQDGCYYAYATQSFYPGTKFNNIQLARSVDLIHWKYLGDAMPQKPSWTKQKQEIWAPDVHFFDGKYFMYFASQHDNKSGMCLGVAVADEPEGPFVPSNEPLLCGNTFEALDPFAFDDPATGKKLLYWGSASKPIMVQELADDRLHFKKGTTPLKVMTIDTTPYHRLIEASWVIKRGKYYYLFYSGDNCCDPDPHYAVLVARSESATGPFISKGRETGTNNSVILEGNQKWLAPGHNAIISDEVGDDWIVYHAMNAKYPRIKEPNGKLNVRRILCLDKITYLKGWPTIENNSPSFVHKQRPIVEKKYSTE